MDDIVTASYIQSLILYFTINNGTTESEQYLRKVIIKELEKEKGILFDGALRELCTRELK